MRSLIKSTRGLRSLSRRIWPSLLVERGANCVIHPSVAFEGNAENVVIGDNVHIEKNVTIYCSGTHSSVVIGDNSWIGPFVQLRAAKDGSIRIGARTSINHFSMIYGAGKVSIGDDTRIAAHVIIVSYDHVFDDIDRTIKSQGLRLKPVSIGNDVWLGGGARILGGVRIEDKSVVGAGAVVTRDIPFASIAVGVPARVINRRDSGSAAGK
jgi:acetyltransferase-like isoleucine patch superfamily enzyme